MDTFQYTMSDLPELETKCDYCEGRGVFTSDFGGKPDACHECQGSGFLPTQFGARILELVRHNSRVEISAELRVSGAGS